MIKGTLPSQESYVEKAKQFSMVVNDGALNAVSAFSYTFGAALPPQTGYYVIYYTSLRNQEKKELAKKSNQIKSNFTMYF